MSKKLKPKPNPKPKPEPEPEAEAAPDKTVRPSVSLTRQEQGAVISALACVLDRRELRDSSSPFDERAESALRKMREAGW